MKKIYSTLVFFVTLTTNAQIGIGTSSPSASAKLEISSTSRGFLLPRVALTGTADIATIASPATALLVYNTATAGTSPNNVTPGFYFYSGAAWVRIVTPTDNVTNVTGTVVVSNGGTGATTLTANNVLLGNGTSALQAVAPGTSGNVLTSNGTTWTSAAAGGGLPTTGNIAGDMLYWNGTAWVKVAAGNNGQTLTYINNVPTWYGGNGTVVSTTGKIWMDRNLGASRVATSSTDFLSYGSIYQWGRGNDGHQLMNFTSSTAGSGVNTTVTTLSTTDIPGNSSFIGACPGANNYDWRSVKNDNLWQGVNGTNNPCPSGYRLPTETEWVAEYATWAANSSGAFSSVLKIPLAGIRSCCGGGLEITGTGSIYWSSTVNGTQARTLYYGPWPSTTVGISNSNRADGRTVRCIKD
jgi:hypothetical protein